MFPKGLFSIQLQYAFKIKLYYTLQNLSYDCLLKPSYIYIYDTKNLKVVLLVFS